MNKRLKLYDEELRIYISKKDKNKFRKIAYRNKKTMSEYARLLIKHAIALDELENNLDKMSSLIEIDDLLNELGRKWV